jgi:hypothetical protein
LAKPRYRKSADRWEVKVDSRYVPILDEVGNFIRGNTRESKLKAEACWHLMLQREQASAKGGDNPVAVVLDLYLDEAQRLHPDRYETLARTFQSFIDLFQNLTVNDLTERHIDDWFAANPTWKSPSTRMTRLASLIAAFNWASKMREGQRLVPIDHPLRALDLTRLQNKAYHRKRTSKTRVEDQVHVFMMHNVAEDFRDVLFALRHSGGTRPGNVCKVSAKNFVEDPGLWVFEEENTEEGNTVHKTYGRTHETLIVPLTQELVDLCKRLRQRHPSGPLFRRASGELWTSQAISDRFSHYRKRFREMGLPIPDTLFAYCYRHESATSLLAAGEAEALTAAVLGQQGTRTLHRHYNHTIAKARELVNALRRQVVTLPGEALVSCEGDAGPAPNGGEPPGQVVEQEPAEGPERS